MPLRLLLLSLLALLLGCTASEPAADVADVVEIAAARSLEGISGVETWTDGTAELVVLYRDESGGPVRGIQIDFVLMDAAPGASLWPSRVYTDQAGVARTELRAGSTAMALTVRASAPGTPPAYLDVNVREALATTLAVRVRYEDTRVVHSYTVTALEETTCQEALAADATGEVSHTLSPKDVSVGFSVAAGSTSALMAWAHDATGATIARGCVEYRAARTADAARERAEVVIPLDSTPLALSPELEL